MDRREQGGKGTGLGLSISMSILSAHQGRLWIDNDSEQTRFIAWFPKDPAALLETNAA